MSLAQRFNSPAPRSSTKCANVWWLIKRKTNVYLVVDTSGSMEGAKLANVKDALTTFVNQIEGADERVGLIEFWGKVDVLVPAGPAGRQRD